MPADLAFVTVLQLTLIMEIALLHKVNLKSERARGEVFEVLGYSNGADTVNLAGRAGPKLIARIAEKALTKRDRRPHVPGAVPPPRTDRADGRRLRRGRRRAERVALDGGGLRAAVARIRRLRARGRRAARGNRS